MTRALNDVTRARVRASSEALMVDTCVRRAWTVIRDSDNQEAGEDWIDAETSRCGYQAARGLQTASRESSTNVVVDSDSVRVPLAFAALLTSRDRLRVTTRAGITIDRAIDGDPQVGVTAARVNLKGSST